MNFNVGITGSSGVLGSILCKDFDAMGIKYSCFKGDICSREEVSSWVNNSSFDSVLHLAAIVPTVEVKENPRKAYEVNVGGTKNLVDALNSLEIKPWLFYTSTSHVYQSKNSPINEEDIISPISEYGKTKYEAEKVITESYENYCIGRIFSFYHGSQNGPFLYPNIKRRLQEEDLSKEFKLYGADSIRDFLNAEDVSRIIIDLMNKKVIGTYNIASGKGTRIEDFIRSLTDVDLKIKKMGSADYLVADTTNLNKVLKGEN